MKQLIYPILIVLAGTLQAIGQKAEKVPYFLKDKREVSFYKQQRTLWEAETKKNPKNEEAWLNLFTAVRALGMFEPFPNSEKEQEVIVAKMEKAIPNTFAYNYVKGWFMGAWQLEGMKYIEKAYQMRPENPVVYKELVVRLEASQNLARRKEFNQKWFASGDFSPGILAYNRNVLASVEKNAILVTMGDLDTYPLWMLQDVHGFRQDVVPINMYMVRMTDYRQKLLKNNGLYLPDSISNALTQDFENGVNLNWPEEKKSQWVVKLIEALHTYNPDRPLYIGLTANLKGLEEKLFLTGLASKYSDIKFDNLAAMKKNYEQVYFLDYLKLQLQPDPTQFFVNLCNQNYVPSFLKLYHHYKDSGETDKASKVRVYLEILAKESKKEEELQKLLD